MNSQRQNAFLDDSLSRTRSKSKSPSKYIHTSEINLDGLGRKMNDVSILLNENSENLNSFLIFFSRVIISFTSLTRTITQYYSDKLNSNKNKNLEFELYKKNEFYLKNSLICVLKKLIEKDSVVSHDELKINLDTLVQRLDELSPIELNKGCLDIIDKFSSKLESFNNEKSLEVGNLNEKVIYYLREIEILKKNEKSEIPQITNTSSNPTGTNTQIVKLTSQLKLKEEEIQRLNKRLEEHLKTIKSLTNELDLKKENGESEKEKESYFKNLAEKEKININNTKNNLQVKMSLYEDEINDLKKQINDQKYDFEKEKIIIQKRQEEDKLKLDKMTKKDSGTGKYIIKDYLNKTATFFEDFYKFFNSNSNE